MTMSNTIRTASATAGMLAFTAVALSGPASAESPFKALAGLNAQPMSAAEMEATQGKAFVANSFWNGQWYTNPTPFYVKESNPPPLMQQLYPWVFTKEDGAIPLPGWGSLAPGVKSGGAPNPTEPQQFLSVGLPRPGSYTFGPAYSQLRSVFGLPGDRVVLTPYQPIPAPGATYVPSR